MGKNTNQVVTTSAAINFSALSHVSAADVTLDTKKGGGNSVPGLSIVNTPDNGCRINLTKSLMEKLGNPQAVQVALDEKFLYIGQVIPGSEESFAFSKGKGSNVLYNRGLVTYLTKHFGLNFSECTSISFRDVRIEEQTHEGAEIAFAVVRMIADEESADNLTGEKI